MKTIKPYVQEVCSNCDHSYVLRWEYCIKYEALLLPHKVYRCDKLKQYLKDHKEEL